MKTSSRRGERSYPPITTSSNYRWPIQFIYELYCSCVGEYFYGSTRFHSCIHYGGFLYANDTTTKVWEMASVYDSVNSKFLHYYSSIYDFSPGAANTTRPSTATTSALHPPSPKSSFRFTRFITPKLTPHPEIYNPQHHGHHLLVLHLPKPKIRVKSLPPLRRQVIVSPLRLRTPKASMQRLPNRFHNRCAKSENLRRGRLPLHPLGTIQLHLPSLPLKTILYRHRTMAFLRIQGMKRNLPRLILSRSRDNPQLSSANLL